MALEHVRALSGTAADLDTPEYQRLKEQLGAIRAAHTELRFVYLLGRTPEQRVIFHADSEPGGSEEESPPGEVYAEATPELRAVFDSGNPFVEGPLPDEWETWVSALGPRMDQEFQRLCAELNPDTGEPSHIKGQ